MERVEKKVVKSAIRAMINIPAPEEQEEKIVEQTTGVVNQEPSKEEPKGKRNERSYLRNRGKDGAKAMSYYLTHDLIEALELRATKDKVDKSEIVRQALRTKLREELKELKENIRNGVNE